jgi:hypothetical protein
MPRRTPDPGGTPMPVRMSPALTLATSSSIGSDRIHPIILDVTVEAAIGSAAASVRQRVGDDGLAGLVYNCGHRRTGTAGVPAGRAAAKGARGERGRTGGGHPGVPATGSNGARADRLHGVARRPCRVAGDRVVQRVEVRARGPRRCLEDGTEGLRDRGVRHRTRPRSSRPSGRETWRPSDALLMEMPREARTRYERVTTGMFAWAERSRSAGIPMDEVTGALGHARRAARPKTRYAVGRGSRLYLLLRFLPDRLRDRLIAGSLHRVGLRSGQASASLPRAAGRG